MAGPLFALGRSLLGSQLTQPFINALVERGLTSGIINPYLAQMLYSSEPLGKQLASNVEPIARLLGVLPEESPNYNLPEDYRVGSQGEIYNLAGDRMVTGEGVMNFQPEMQYGEYMFQEPMYEPPVPDNYSLYNPGEIPSQIPIKSPQEEYGQPSRKTDLWEPDLSGEASGFESVLQAPLGADDGFMPSNPFSNAIAQEEVQELENRYVGGAHGGVVANGSIAQRKQQQKEAAKMKAQALLRTGVPMPDEYRQGGRVRMI